MNINASFNSAIADLGSPTETAPAPAANSGAASVLASSSALMQVADEAVEEDTSALGGVNAWA